MDLGIIIDDIAQFCLRNIFMKQLLDFIPIVVFFIFYKNDDIFIATQALLIASVFQMIIIYIIYRAFEKAQLISFYVSLLFGGLTLLFQDASFIKIKLSIVYGIFGIVLLISELLHRSILKRMIPNELQLSDVLIAKLSYIWSGYFFVCAVLNLYIAYYFSEATWVNFKVFFFPLMMLVFMILNVLYIYKKRV